MDHPHHGVSRQRSLLVVAGSGRSGTSLFTGLVGRLGLYIPQPEMKANDSNPRGYGEPRWSIAFHKELLSSVDVTHDDGRPKAWRQTARVAVRSAPQDRLRSWLSEQFDQSDRVVVKDPRLAWFVGLYAQVAEELSAELSTVTMLRHPAETVRSKVLAYGGRSDGTTRTAGWLNMMLGVEKETRELPRAVIRYDDLLEHWQPTLTSAESALPLALVSRASAEEIADADALVDPTLRRTNRDWTELNLPEPLRDLAESTYQALCPIAVAPDGRAPSTSFEELDQLRESFAAYYRDAEALVKSSLNAARAAERPGKEEPKAQRKVNKPPARKKAQSPAAAQPKAQRKTNRPAAQNPNSSPSLSGSPSPGPNPSPNPSANPSPSGSPSPNPASRPGSRTLAGLKRRTGWLRIRS